MRERRSKLDPLSRVITLGYIDCLTVNEIIQDIYEINVRQASKYATFMYHEGNYEVEGKVAFHKQELAECVRIDKVCDTYFMSKTKFTDKILKPHRDRQAEWYFDVKTAQRYGLVDEILE